MSHHPSHGRLHSPSRDSFQVVLKTEHESGRFRDTCGVSQIPPPPKSPQVPIQGLGGVLWIHSTYGTKDYLCVSVSTILSGNQPAPAVPQNGCCCVSSYLCWKCQRRFGGTLQGPLSNDSSPGHRAEHHPCSTTKVVTAQSDCL